MSPVIVAPGRWSRSDIRFQAWHIATQRLHNSGFNCVASQIVVVSKNWPQKNEFLRALRAALAQAPPRPAWYPGAADGLGIGDTDIFDWGGVLSALIGTIIVLVITTFVLRRVSRRSAAPESQKVS